MRWHELKRKMSVVIKFEHSSQLCRIDHLDTPGAKSSQRSQPQAPCAITTVSPTPLALSDDYFIQHLALIDGAPVRRV